MKGSTMLIRTMQPQEVSALARIYVDTFTATHTGIVSERFLQALSYESAQRRLEGIFNKQEHHPWGYVCDSGRALVGFAVGDLAGNPPAGYHGELKILSILPVYNRMGIGRTLMRAAAVHFEREGIASMFVGVFTNNFPARRFYEALGGRKIDEQLEEIGGESLMVTRYGWPSVQRLIRLLGASLYLDRVISRKISLSTQILPSFLPVVLV